MNAPELAAEVAELKDQARIGDLAETKMAEAQQALEQFGLRLRCRRGGSGWRSIMPSCRRRFRPDELIATYKDMAARGMAATNQLQIAHIQAGNWADYADTRAAAVAAAADFAALGDAEQRTDADRLVSALDQEQLRIVLLLGALAALTFGWLFLWLRTRGPQPLRWE
ncbi:MAG: hypothetical protein R2848_18155 [Thermomicrobiales bacterium]